MGKDQSIIDLTGQWDVLCIQEHWLTSLECGQTFLQDGFTFHSSPAEHLTPHSSGGRLSGGVGLVLRQGKILSSKAAVSHPTHIWVSITVSHIATPFHICSAYLRSTMSMKDRARVLEVIHQETIKFQSKGFAVLCGEFNSRLGDRSQEFFDEESDDFESFARPQTIARRSQDSVVSAHEKAVGAATSFFSTVSSLGLVILHGIDKCDDGPTFAGSQGSSAVDFICIEKSLLPHMTSSSIVPIGRELSDHHLCSTVLKLSQFHSAGRSMNPSPSVTNLAVSLEIPTSAHSTSAILHPGAPSLSFSDEAPIFNASSCDATPSHSTAGCTANNQTHVSSSAVPMFGNPLLLNQKTLPCKIKKRMVREDVREHQAQCNGIFSQLLQDLINETSPRNQQNLSQPSERVHKLHGLVLTSLKQALDTYGVTVKAAKRWRDPEISALTLKRSQTIHQLKELDDNHPLKPYLKQLANRLKLQCRTLMKQRVKKIKDKIADDMEGERKTNAALFWIKVEKMLVVSLAVKQIKLPQAIRNRQGQPVVGDEEVEAWREFWAETYQSQEIAERNAVEHISDPPLEDEHIEDEDQSTKAQLNRSITYEEVSAALKNLKNRRAPGVEGIPAELLKYSGPAIVSCITLFFNQIFASSHIPLSWKLGIITPVPKKFESRDDPNGYRGITVLSVMAKIFGLVLNHRLMAYCEENHILAEEQNGFRPDRGTLDNMMIMADIIEYRRARKLPTFCAYLDVRKAYNTV